MHKRVVKVAMSEEWPSHHNVYTPATLAERWKCSAELIRTMINRGDLPFYKYGDKLVRIRTADVVAYETGHSVKPRVRD